MLRYWEIVRAGRSVASSELDGGGADDDSFWSGTGSMVMGLLRCRDDRLSPLGATIVRLRFVCGRGQSSSSSTSVPNLYLYGGWRVPGVWIEYRYIIER